MKPLEIYLHIPFCAKKCRYCDFLSAPADRETQKAYIDAMKMKSCVSRSREIQSRYGVFRRRDSLPPAWKGH